jgi:hypothetical protein
MSRRKREKFSVHRSAQDIENSTARLWDFGPISLERKVTERTWNLRLCVVFIVLSFYRFDSVQVCGSCESLFVPRMTKKPKRQKRDFAQIAHAVAEKAAGGSIEKA